MTTSVRLARDRVEVRRGSTGQKLGSVVDLLDGLGWGHLISEVGVKREEKDVTVFGDEIFLIFQFAVNYEDVQEFP